MALHFPKALALGLAGAATLALGGCYEDGYGYGGVEAGAGYYGGGYGYDGYDPYYAGGYGYGYGGYGGYGWFDGFYYPGTGIYVYDRGGNRRRMRDGDWQHWRGRGRDGQGQAGDWHGRGASDPGRSYGWRRRNGAPDGQVGQNAPSAPSAIAPRPDRGQWQGRAGDGARTGFRGEGGAGRWQQRSPQPGASPQGFRGAPAAQRGDGGAGRYSGRRRGD